MVGVVVVRACRRVRCACLHHIPPLVRAAAARGRGLLAWPTRSELVTYTSVVLVFVVIIMAFVTIVDFGIGKLTFWIFGG